MKKQLFTAALSIALAACGGSQNQNNGNAESANAESANTNASTTSAQSVSKAKTVNWQKVLCKITDDGDTMLLNIYDDKNRIIKSLNNLENGKAECETVYKYDGNKAIVTNSCMGDFMGEITYADEKCEKIIENCGQIYQYDSQDRLVGIIEDGNEFTYTYETDPKTGNTIVSFKDAGGVINEEHRDKLNRIVSERHTHNLDAFSTTYEYHEDYALATVKNTITPKDDDGTPNPDQAYEDTWQYMIYFLKE